MLGSTAAAVQDCTSENTLHRVPLLIAGSEHSGASRLGAVEPSRGGIAHEIEVAGQTEVDTAVKAAREAFRDFGRSPSHARAKILHAVAKAVAANKSFFVEAMITSSGKVRKDAAGEVDRSVETLAIAAEEALRIEGFEVPMDSSPRGEGRIAIARRFPVGVLAAITPFNAPLNTVCHKIAPAIAAGNVVVLKPDVRGARVANKLALLFQEAGLPDGVLNVIHGDAETGEALVTHPGVDIVGFTGSEAVGERITRIAGLKRVLLELGGNAPVIVHHDAHLETAASAIAPAGFGMSGQSCISVQRVYVHEDVYEQMVERLTEKAKSLRIGPPEDPNADIGPMVTEDAAKRVERVVGEAVAQGAHLVCGGERDGPYMTPTILTHVELEMTAVGCEIFGPVISVISYRDLDEVLEQANGTPYGLQAGVFTNSLDLVMRASRELRFGGIIINNVSRWRLDHMPYGGVKRSGFGREGAKYAIEDMTELRMVVLG
jgi:acyl-CoA reductase-like NAD-dependent aldehyde dehydrogenase